MEIGMRESSIKEREQIEKNMQKKIQPMVIAALARIKKLTLSKIKEIIQRRRKTPAFRHGDIRRVRRICVSN